MLKKDDNKLEFQRSIFVRNSGHRLETNGPKPNSIAMMSTKETCPLDPICMLVVLRRRRWIRSGVQTVDENSIVRSCAVLALMINRARRNTPCLVRFAGRVRVIRFRCARVKTTHERMLYSRMSYCRRAIDNDGNVEECDCRETRGEHNVPVTRLVITFCYEYGDGAQSCKMTLPTCARSISRVPFVRTTRGFKCGLERGSFISAKW